MLREDDFSRYLGIRMVTLQEGACTVALAVTSGMANGFGIAHGGIAFALADSAMAFASNYHANVFVAVSNSIIYLHQIELGDKLEAIATEIVRSGRTATYDVVLRRNGLENIALFRGTVV